jgi:D-glycero-D-manno-heptose 1,7-bisphosphate phosphatase
MGHFDEELGMWVAVPGDRRAVARPALFLDRDGVIVEDHGYLSRSADVIAIAGAAEIIGLANRRGIPVIEVTNQSGVGRGYYGWEEFQRVEEAMAEELARSGAVVDAVFACPYHPAHPARKPLPGMLLAARRFLNVELESSWIVGDKLSDLEAGYNAGLRGGMHVSTGHGAEQRAAVAAWRPANFEVRFGESIRDAAGLVESLARPG